MSPSIPYVERVAAEDDVIPLSEPILSTSGTSITEISIKKGQILQLPYVAINRLGWTDGRVFKPSRWLNDKPQPESSQLPRGWSGTLAFGDGPRNCVGFRLGKPVVVVHRKGCIINLPPALFELRVIVASLVRQFEFSDSGAIIDFKVAASIQAYVRGQEHEGPKLPVAIRAI
jgi:hypothetical protein